MFSTVPPIYLFLIYRVQDGKVAFRTEFPGLDIEYYVDSEKAWKIASHNMPISNPLKIRTR